MYGRVALTDRRIACSNDMRGWKRRIQIRGPSNTMPVITPMFPRTIWRSNIDSIESMLSDTVNRPTICEALQKAERNVTLPYIRLRSNDDQHCLRSCVQLVWSRDNASEIEKQANRPGGLRRDELMQTTSLKSSSRLIVIVQFSHQRIASTLMLHRFLVEESTTYQLSKR